MLSWVKSLLLYKLMSLPMILHHQLEVSQAAKESMNSLKNKNNGMKNVYEGDCKAIMRKLVEL